MHSESTGKEGASGGRDRPLTTSDMLREQQAIAAAIMIGEEMRRSDRTETYVLARRIGIFVVAMAVCGLVILFGFARLAGDEFNPFPYMLLLGLVAAGGGAAAYWGYVEARRHKE